MFLGHMSNLMVHYNIQLPIHYSSRIHLHCTAITTLMCQGILVTKRTRRKHYIPQAQMLSYQFWKCVIITIHGCSTLYYNVHTIFHVQLVKECTMYVKYVHNFREERSFAHRVENQLRPIRNDCHFPIFLPFHDLLHIFLIFCYVSQSKALVHS